MIYHVHIMESAQDDMRGIHKYIAEDLQNPEAAVRRIKDIEASIRSLYKMPARYALVSDRYLASKGLRMLTVKAHLVFFTVHENPNNVSVIRILYARRDWMRIVKADLEQLSDDGTSNFILE